MKDFVTEYHPASLTAALVTLAGWEETISDAECYEMVETMHAFLDIATNKCNRDGFRLIYKALDEATERLRMGDIKTD